MPPTIPDDRLIDALRRLTSLASADGSAAELAEAIAHEVRGLLQTDASGIFQIDGDEIVVVGAATAPGHGIFTPGTRFRIEPEMIVAAIQETGRATRSANYENDPSDAGRRVVALGYDAVVGAPVHVEGRLWGVIYAATKGTERLPAGSQDELGVFAELCSIAVARAAQLARSEAQAAEQQALMSVARTVLAGAAEDEVLAAVAREAAAVLGVTAAALLRDRGDDPFEVVSTWSSEGALEVTGAGAEAEIADLVRRERRVHLIGDPDATARTADGSILGRQVGWAAPVEIAGELWGVVVVAGEQGIPVPPDAAERVARFAGLSGLAIGRMQARRELVEQVVETERFAALVELSDDFIAISDLDARAVYLNAAGRRMVGLPDDLDVGGRDIRDVLTEEGVRHLEAVSIPSVVRRGAFRGETTLRHQVTGEEIPVAVNAFMIHHPTSGAPSAIAIVQHDLRERRQAEVQLRERAEQVEQLAAARRSLLVETLESEDRMRRQIGDALHDEVLQELYAARLDLANAGKDAEALHRARVAVDAASRQLRSAVSDLHPAVSWTRDLESRLRAILEQAGDRAGVAHRLECTARTSGRTDDLVIGLIRELVQNVVKHAAATFVTAQVAEQDDGILVEVADDGRGFAPERPAEALRSGHIGLASARERVEALGGRFEVETTPGAGTCVRAFLPGLA